MRPGYKVSKTIMYSLQQGFIDVLKVPLPPQKALPTENPVFKNMSL